MDDEELAGEIQEVFLGDMPKQIHGPARRARRGDAPVAERVAHSIKGASANVGGERVRGIALAMEQSARAGDLAAVGARMGDLDTEFGRLRDAMQGDDCSQALGVG